MQLLQFWSGGGGLKAAKLAFCALLPSECRWLQRCNCGSLQTFEEITAASYDPVTRRWPRAQCVVHMVAAYGEYKLQTRKIGKPRI